MKLQYISDLHDKYIELTKTANYLALCGDIGNPYNNDYIEILTKYSKQYEKIFLITGNHEYGIHDKDDVDKYIKKIVVEISDNIIFLNKEKYIINDICILGCTLWSDCKISESIHKEHVDWLKNEIENSKLPIIILTHHAPCIEMNGDYMFNTNTSLFSSDLVYLFKYPVRGWISGHTHQSIRIKLNGIKCVSNCLGYDDENNTRYDIGTYITLK